MAGNLGGVHRGEGCRSLVAAGAIVAATFLGACATVAGPRERAQAKIQYDIAVAEVTKGDMRGALRDLLRCVDLDPELPQARNAIGLVFHALGRTDEALMHYEKAVALKPDFSEAHNNLGILLIALGRYEEAIPHFEKALNDILYPTPSLAEGNLGWAIYKLGDVPAAVRHLRNAVATNPKFCRGYEWLARIGLDTEAADQTVSNCGRFEKYCLGDPSIAAQLPPHYADEMRYTCGLGQLQAGNTSAAHAAFAACAESEAPAIADECRASLTGVP